MIALDTSALALRLVPDAPIFKAGTNAPVRHAKERMEALVDSASKRGEPLLIPTPVIAELLARLPGKAGNVLQVLQRSRWFRIAAFDLAAAVELGERTAKAIAAGDKRDGIDAPWAKVKFDRQIIAIAITNGASELISNDAALAKTGESRGIRIVGVDDLPVPESLIPPPLLASLEDDGAE